MLTANKITEIEKTAELRGMLPGKSGFKSFVEEMAHNYDITQTEVRKLFTKKWIPQYIPGTSTTKPY